ncbi:L,D-transpeptidase family protein [Flavobacterium sp. GCM10023249]|uniref:L,D-transpeptidase family protein n=1 Tax=unclassified Flavobacterium TaxID=196869 RepID=UPI00360EAB0E
MAILMVFRKKIADWYFKNKTKHTVEQVISKHEKKVLEKYTLNFKEAKIDSTNFEIALLAFKDTRKLELYAKNPNSDYKHLKTYDFTAFSGKIGPKLVNGDKQIPEGIYSMEYLNPNSRYHLSMKVSYPNAFDLEKAKTDGRTDLGGDIMIHGKKVTIGCIPIGDKNIEEVFTLAAKSTNQRFPIIIAPTDFRKNKKFPVIESINWENELYSTIQFALEKYNTL